MTVKTINATKSTNEATKRRSTRKTKRKTTPKTSVQTAYSERNDSVQSTYSERKDSVQSTYSERNITPDEVKDAADPETGALSALVETPEVDLSKATDISNITPLSSEITVATPAEAVKAAEPIAITPFVAPAEEDEAPRPEYSRDTEDGNSGDYSDENSQSYKIRGLAELLSIVLGGIDGFLTAIAY
ncbi:MAG: hypothetical protein FWE97_01865 [Dehalococcoidia bacterium]|nr:hypothetical protein [Dehalococcoidia bacterium]